MPPILVPSFATLIKTQNLAISKLIGRKNLILRGYVYDLIRPSKKLAT